MNREPSSMQDDAIVTGILRGLLLFDIAESIDLQQLHAKPPGTSRAPSGAGIRRI
jgi:hypothetical protein